MYCIYYSESVHLSVNEFRTWTCDPLHDNCSCFFTKENKKDLKIYHLWLIPCFDSHCTFKPLSITDTIHSIHSLYKLYIITILTIKSCRNTMYMYLQGVITSFLLSHCTYWKSKHCWYTVENNLGYSHSWKLKVQQYLTSWSWNEKGYFTEMTLFKTGFTELTSLQFIIVKRTYNTRTFSDSPVCISHIPTYKQC